MTASYPTAVQSGFVVKTDLADHILANDVNALQDEVFAVETTLGANVHVSTSPSTGGTFNATSTVFASLGARLANIEIGIVGDSHSQYVKGTGGAVVTTSNNAVIPFTVQGKAGQTADIFKVISSTGTIYLQVTSTGAVNVLGQSLPVGRVCSATQTSNGGASGAGNEQMLTSLAQTFTFVSGRKYRCTVQLVVGDSANRAAGLVLKLHDGLLSGNAVISAAPLADTINSNGVGGTAISYTFYLDNLSAGSHSVTPSITSTSTGSLLILASTSVPVYVWTEDIGT